MTFDPTSLPEILTTPSHFDWRQIILDDLEVTARDAGIERPPVQEGGEWWLLAGLCATAADLMTAQFRAGVWAADPATATGDALDDLRVQLGLPEISATGGQGNVTVTVTGTATFTAGDTLTAPGGLRGQVLETTIITTSTSPKVVPVQMTDTGAATNLAAGVTVRFDSPPVNAFTAALVTAEFTGGVDTESDDSKRERVVSALRTAGAYGSPGYIRQQVLGIDNLAPDDCYIYRAHGGPGTFKIVPVMTGPGSRSASAARISAIQSAISAVVPPEVHFEVQNAEDVAVDVALEVTLSGGTHAWTDTAPAPLLASTAAPCTVTTVGAGYINIGNATGIAVGKNITISCAASGEISEHVVTYCTTSGGNIWQIVVTPDVPSDVVAGDYVYPSVSVSADSVSLHDAWFAALGSIAPGQQTTEATLAQCIRTPRVADGAPSDSVASAVGSMFRAYPTAADEYSVVYASQSVPVIPASTSSPPQILIPRRFAVYPKA